MIAGQIGSESTLRFVDIGSGVGKLCILLSFLTRMEIFGVEQRRHLHEIAETIVSTNAITRVNLSHGNMMDIEWEKFDVFFLFNPFQEHNLKSDIFAIDQKVNLEPDLYVKYVTFVENKLENLSVGKRVITLEGFGGTIPKTWRLISSDQVVDSKLNHWIKVGC